MGIECNVADGAFQLARLGGKGTECDGSKAKKKEFFHDKWVLRMNEIKINKFLI